MYILHYFIKIYWVRRPLDTGGSTSRSYEKYWVIPSTSGLCDMISEFCYIAIIMTKYKIKLHCEVTARYTSVLINEDFSQIVSFLP